MTKPLPAFRHFDRWLIDKLKVPVTAVEYLRDHLADDGLGDHKELLTLALINIGAAYGIRLEAK